MKGNLRISISNNTKIPAALLKTNIRPIVSQNFLSIRQTSSGVHWSNQEEETIPIDCQIN